MTTDNNKSEKKSRGGMIKVGIGPEWNTSKIYYEGSNYLSYIRGNAVSLSVTSTEGKAYGFGFDLYGSITEADIPSYKYSSYEKYDLTLLYLGPSAVFGGHITDRLRMDIVVSTGVAYFQDNDYTQIGIGLWIYWGLPLSLVTQVVPDYLRMSPTAISNWVSCYPAGSTSKKSSPQALLSLRISFFMILHFLFFLL